MYICVLNCVPDFCFACLRSFQVDGKLTPDDLDHHFLGHHTRLELLSLPSKAFDKAEEIARRVWEAGWTVVHHNHLPQWLRDNDFLVKGHRPPLNSFYSCFKSIFRIHTETGNIWTHLLGKLNVVDQIGTHLEG